MPEKYESVRRERERELQAVNRALVEGEESGDAGELDMEAIRAEARRKAGLNSARG